MKEMLAVNRLGVLFIIGCATLGSFFIDSIIDAIHIATFIASSSYFFALMGGMYWRRGTAAGAAASMVIGFISQCALIIIDLRLTQAGAPPYLESLHPVLMGHGVIAAMAVSGLAYGLVSLVTAPVATSRLAPFFPDQARLLVAGVAVSHNGALSPVTDGLVEDRDGERIYLRLSLDLPENFSWREIVRLMTHANSHWLAMGGDESVRRCTRADIFSCVTLVRGEQQTGGWLEVEGATSAVQELKNEVAMAYHEIAAVLGAVSKPQPQPVAVKESHSL
jgi:SSS family solute:Na+ symporter